MAKIENTDYDIQEFDLDDLVDAYRISAGRQG